MSITYEINKEMNGIEIKFSEKPSKALLQKMKEMGFRWHNQKGVWYAKITEERLTFAKAIKDENIYQQISLKLVDSKDEKAPSKSVETPKAKQTKEVKAEPKKATRKATHKKAENVVEFPQFTFDFTPKNASVEDCKKKMDEERKLFAEPQHQYVINGIMKMVEASEDFRINLLDSEKTYTKAFKYVTEQARKQAKNGCACFTADKVIELALDYYNKKETKVKEG